MVRLSLWGRSARHVETARSRMATQARAQTRAGARAPTSGAEAHRLTAVNAHGGVKRVRLNIPSEGVKLPGERVHRLRGRKVAQGAPARARFGRLRGVVLSLRSLLSRKRSTMLIAPSRVNVGPQAESAQLLNALARPGLPMQSILEALHLSCATANPNLSDDASGQVRFERVLKENITRLDDSQLYRLHRKLTSKRMLHLRAGLKNAESSRAAGDDRHKTKVMQREFSAMGETLDDIDWHIRSALDERGYNFSSPRPPRSGGKATRRVEDEMHLFMARAGSDFTAGGGTLPDSMRIRLESLARVRGEDARESAALKERDNPASGFLPITRDFLKNCGSNKITLHTEEGRIAPGDIDKGTVWDLDDEDARAAIARDMLSVCDNNEEQCLRLSHMLTRNIVEAARGDFVNFRDGENKFVSLPIERVVESRLQHKSAPSFSVERVGDGDVRLRLEETIQMQGLVSIPPYQRAEPFDQRKSALHYAVDFIVPAEAGEPIEVDTTRYSYQVFKDALIRDDINPMHLEDQIYMRAV